MKAIQIILKKIPVLFVLFLATSCYYDTILEEQPDPNDIGTMSFENDIIPIFNASCNMAGCHNGGIAPDLREDKAYDALIGGSFINLATPENSELYQWMKGNRSLPMPVSGANADYNAKVLAWITQGAENN